MSLVNSRNAVINPVNGQSNFNVSSGEMNIHFEISGAPNELLDLKSIRLNCKIRQTNKSLAGVVQNMNNNQINALENYGTNYVSIDERLGCSSMIQSIRIEDSQNNVLEHIHNYGHLMASIIPQTLNQDDITTWTGPCYGLKSAGKRNIQMNQLNQSQFVSMKLYTGLFNSKPIPFSAIGNILRVTVTLANPQTVYFGGNINYANDIGANTYAGGISTNANFNFENVKMNYRVVEMDGQAPMPQGGAFVYRYFSNLQSTINASSYQNMYSPNTSNTISLINNFISSDSLNNINRNSFLIQKLSNGRTVAGGGGDVENFVDIKETQFKINGVLSPLQFSVDERVYTPNYDVLKALYYMSAITPYNMIQHSLISNASESYGGSKCQGKDIDRRPVAGGVAVRYDNLNTGEGQSFKGGNNYIHKIDSDLNGNNPNEIMTTVYSFRKIVLQPTGSVIVN